jgi:hypothetical protein
MPAPRVRPRARAIARAPPIDPPPILRLKTDADELDSAVQEFEVRRVFALKSCTEYTGGGLSGVRPEKSPLMHNRIIGDSPASY